MKRKATCIMGLAGCFAGLAIVHALTYISAITDKTQHLTNRQAFWDAVFYDFLVGIPVAGLCGWLTAATIARRFKNDPEPETETDGAAADSPDSPHL